MENKILPSCSGGYDIDSFGMHFGPRIARPVDLPEFSWSPEPRSKENGPILGTVMEENTSESTVNQSKNAKMIALGDCFKGDQFIYQNHVGPLRMQSGQHQDSHWKSDVRTGEIPESQNWISHTSNMVAQAGHGKSFSNSGYSYTEKSQFHHHQEDLVPGNPVVGVSVASRMPLEMHNVSRGSMRHIGAAEQNFLQLDTSYASSRGRGCPMEANRFRTSCVSERNLQCSISTGSNNPSSREILSSGVSASAEQKVGGMSLQNDVHSFIDSIGNCVDNSLETSGVSHMDGHMKPKDPDAIDKQNTRSTLIDGRSSNNDHCPSNGVQPESNQSNCSSHRLDEKSRLLSNKASLAAEKLWDGSLQLNSSITVSVVAFFKSGEKLLDLQWSEFVEVKGKVRLEAFEKYIKDLPRSRSRGLMVISLCFKEGSSEKGLKGMKEVAKGYMKGERVGFAKLSPGVDLYLCPRSDAIITILAKYGFFKGMAAVEGNSELMIGCVVWRKNRITLTSAAEKSEGKPASLPEQSDSSTLQGGGQSSLSVSLVENSKPPTPLNSSSPLEQADITDEKNVSIDSVNRTIVTTSTVKSPTFQQKESGVTSSHFRGSRGNLMSSEASCVQQSKAEPPMESTDLQEAVSSLVSNASKPKMAFSDDDDLPEFDFGGASGKSSGSHCSDGSLLDKRLGNRILDMSKQPTMPVAPSVSHCIPRPVSSVGRGMPLVGSVTGNGSPIVPISNMGKRNLFCDDDMPEWLPPDAQNDKTNEPPGIFAPESSNLNSRKLSPFPTGSVVHCPSTTKTDDKSSHQSPGLYKLPAHFKVPPPVPSQDGSYLTGFTFNPDPRPQANSAPWPQASLLAAETPLQPADKRVRRS